MKDLYQCIENLTYNVGIELDMCVRRVNIDRTHGWFGVVVIIVRD